MYATLKTLQIETDNLNFLLFKYNQKPIKNYFPQYSQQPIKITSIITLRTNEVLNICRRHVRRQ